EDFNENEELLQINDEAVNIDINNELAIEKFFNIKMFEQNLKKTDEDNSATYSQRPTTRTDENWSIDDIFSQS
ncbi:1746_t:CDS:1, partial [Dentiscutata erythropus]